MADAPYPCPCCGGAVADVYDERDAMCCYCRNIDDPRLAPEVRERRERVIGPRRCCLRRSRGLPSREKILSRQGELFGVAHG